MRFKIILSNHREVQSDNNQKFMYYMVCISYKKKYKKSKTRWSSNKDAPEVQLLHVVQNTPRKNSACQKQSEVQTDMPEKFNYFTQCISIRDERRNHDLVIF